MPYAFRVPHPILPVPDQFFQSDGTSEYWQGEGHAITIVFWDEEPAETASEEPRAGSEVLAGP